MSTLCVLLSILIADAAGAGSFDAFSSAQVAMSNGSFTLKDRASGGFSENMITASAGFSFEGLGLAAVFGGAYTDAHKPSGYGPDSSGALYPLPSGRSTRYGLQGRYQISMFEVFATYYPSAEFSGTFKADGSGYTYSYKGGGYELGAGVQVAGPLWLQVRLADFTMNSGETSFAAGGGSALSPNLNVHETFVAASLYCTWRDKCFRKR